MFPFALLFVAFSALADNSYPDPPRLIRQAITIRKAQDAKDWKFTWREDEEWRDEKGRPMKPFLRTYDNIMLEGENYRKLILIDGRPLDPKTARKVEADLEKAREERKKRPMFHKVVHMGDLDSLERLFDSRVTGEETVGGRKAWRVESDAKPDAQPADPGERELMAAHRITWFDEEEGIDVRRNTTYTHGVHNIKAGTEAEIEWGRIGEAWLPVSQIFRGQVDFLPGVSARPNKKYRYYDYKRFSVDATFTPN
jgi:hypothetical protein